MANSSEELLNDKLDYLQNTKNLFKAVLEEVGVVITDEDTFRDYANKIRTIDTGDVLLFETEQEMENYDNPQEDMLAIIYTSSVNNMSTTEYMKYLIFSEDVALSEECTNNYNISLINKQGIIVGNAYITPASFYFNINQGVNVEINYSSEDGIHYTRTGIITNPINVVNPITTDVTLDNLKWFSSFIKYEKDEFNGLYKYKNNTYIYISDEIENTLSSEVEEANKLADIIIG